VKGFQQEDMKKVERATFFPFLFSCFHVFLFGITDGILLVLTAGSALIIFLVLT